MPILKRLFMGIRIGFTPLTPTNSIRQVFMDCFSSPDLVNWTKHERIIDTAEVAWADSAMWAPGVIENKGKYFLFLCRQ
jgi:hypothetical protein